MRNEKLIEFRKSVQLKQAEMAKKIGVSASLYEKIEYGQKNSSFAFISKFKKAFPNANIDKIFFSKYNT